MQPATVYGSSLVHPGGQISSVSVRFIPLRSRKPTGAFTQRRRDGPHAHDDAVDVHAVQVDLIPILTYPPRRGVRARRPLQRVTLLFESLHTLAPSNVMVS